MWRLVLGGGIEIHSDRGHFVFLGKWSSVRSGFLSLWALVWGLLYELPINAGPVFVSTVSSVGYSCPIIFIRFYVGSGHGPGTLRLSSTVDCETTVSRPQTLRTMAAQE